MQRQEIFNDLCKQCIGYTSEVALCCRPDSPLPACGKCTLLTEYGCFCVQPVTEVELKAKKCQGFKSKYEEGGDE